MNIRNIFQIKKPIIGIFVVMTIFAITDILRAQVVSGSINGHDYVDLGLPSGVLWATCNLGADSPEEYGDYYAWGETSSKPKNVIREFRLCMASRNHSWFPRCP